MPARAGACACGGGVRARAAALKSAYTFNHYAHIGD